jgi:uncharacterized membrane protein YesL
MKHDLFRHNGPLANFMDKFADCFVLSCMWLLLSLPVITIPLSSICLYDAMAHCTMGTEPGPVKRFWRTAKRELVRGLLMGVEWLAFGAIFFFCYNYLLAMGQQYEFFKMYSILYLATMLVPLGIVLWMVPLQSRFVYGFWELHKVAGTFFLMYLPRTALLVGMLIGFTVLVLLVPNTAILILLIPGFMTLLQTLIIEPVFEDYTPDEA